MSANFEKILTSVAMALMLLGAAGLALTAVFLAEAQDFIKSAFDADGVTRDQALLLAAAWTPSALMVVGGAVIYANVKAGFLREQGPTAVSPRGLAVPDTAMFVGLFSVGFVLVVQNIVGCRLHVAALSPLCLPYEKEGFYEALTALAFIGCTFWLVYLLRRTYSNVKPIRADGLRWARAALATAALGCFFLGMEEISWGQTYIGWETPELFAEANIQKETNLHNLYNDLFTTAYFFASFGVIIVTAAIYPMAAVGKPIPGYSLIAPSPNLIALVIWLPVANLLRTEVVELVAAVIVCVHCWTMHARLAAAAAPADTATVR